MGQWWLRLLGQFLCRAGSPLWALWHLSWPHDSCGQGPFPVGKHEQFKPVTINKELGEGSEPPASPKVTRLLRSDNMSPAEMLSSPLGCLPGCFWKAGGCKCCLSIWQLHSQRTSSHWDCATSGH